MSGGLQRVFVDSNVFYSRTARDWLGLLCTDEHFGAPIVVCWSEDVMAEAMHHLRKKNPTWDGRKISEIRDRIEATFGNGVTSPSSIPLSQEQIEMTRTFMPCCAMRGLLSDDVQRERLHEFLG